jgi:hypothetical protein
MRKRRKRDQLKMPAPLKKRLKSVAEHRHRNMVEQVEYWVERDELEIAKQQ